MVLRNIIGFFPLDPIYKVMHIPGSSLFFRQYCESTSHPDILTIVFEGIPD